MCIFSPSKAKPLMDFLISDPRMIINPIMKKLLLFLIFITLLYSSYSQNQFNNTYDSGEYPFIGTIIQLEDTGYVGIGINTIDFKKVIEINYFDQNGNHIWNKVYSDSLHNTYVGAENACIKTDGGYILAGSKHTLNQDTNMIYLVKFDEQFDTLWTKKHFKSPDWVITRGICNTNDGGYIVVGETQLNNDSIVVGDGWLKGLMIKLDADGNYEWFNSFGTDEYNDGFYKVTQTHDGGYLAAGFTKSWQEGLAGIDQGDWYVVKTDSAGQEEWYRRYGNPVQGEGRVTGLLQSSDTCYYLTGAWAYDRVGSNKYYESYVVKIDQNFEEVYELKYDNQAFDKSFSMGIVETDDQNLVIYGNKYMDFVNYRTTLHKITPEGDLLWNRDFAAQNDTSNFTCSGLSLKQTNDGGFVLGGSAFSIYTTPYQHLWLVKTDSMGCDGTADFRDCFSVGTDEQTACDSYTWMDGNTYTSDNNSANHILTDAAVSGMDSLVVLDLNINPSHTINHVQLACESYTWIDGVTYTENTNTQLMYINQYGCDSIISLDLSIGNNTTGIDHQITCDEITWIDGNTYSEDNNTATFNLEGGSYHGCDSLVTLDLTIQEVNTSLSVSDPSITANATEASFQWLDCNTEFSPINEATEAMFTAASNGLYAVEITQNNCVDTSDCVPITTVNIEELQDRVGFRLYPNPTDHYVVVESYTSTPLSKHKVESITVYDITGKLIKSIAIKENSESQMFDISDLDEGIYMVKVGVFVRKLVVRE